VTTTLTLHDFLDQVGANPRFFGLGRRIEEIPAERFAAFEAAGEPWPQPFQQAAWIGILFDDTRSGEPHLWFLRFPLDERGLLVQAARDEFLRRIIDSAEQPEAARENLDENPFGFRPNEAQMASLHARIADVPSPHYTHALEYFRGEQGFEQWQFVGLQGIADLAARHAEHAGILAAAIPRLPAEPFNVLCGCLENEAIGSDLCAALAGRLDTELASDAPDPVRMAAALRGLSNASDRECAVAAVRRALDSPLGSHPEILAAIAGRAWETLYDDGLRQLFLRHLADSGQRAFDSLLADLLFLPILRRLLLADIRSEAQPPVVRQAVAAFVQRFAKPANGKQTP